MLFNFKKILLTFLFLMSISLVTASDCQFDSMNQDCERFSSSFIDFNLDFTPSELLSKYEAIIYLKDNPNNKIQTIVDNNIVKNINPLIVSGVYVLEINSFTKSGINLVKKFEFIFDNLQPMPPLVPVTINSNIVVGKTNIANLEVFIQVAGGSILDSVISDSEGNFVFNLDLDENKISKLLFFTKNSQGIESSKIYRTVILKNVEEDVTSMISSISIDSNLDELNDRTVKIENKYFTSNRNFLISGLASAQEGTVIYVNGVKTQIINGEFAEFVLLNSGENIILIEDSKNLIHEEIVVEFNEINFQFRTFEVEKIVSENNLKISGSTNLNLEFEVYLNGDFIKTITPISNNFEFYLSSLIPGKNFLYLIGYNGEIIEEIVYLDSENPTIDILSKDKLTSLSNFVFKIKDDLGIDLNSLKFNLVNEDGVIKTYSNKQIEIQGDYFGVLFKDLDDGDYVYNIEITDRSGKITVKSGKVNINKNNVLIEQIDVENGVFLGNSIFLSSEKSKIILKPSKFIAFKHIYLDNFDQIEYEIKSNKFVELYLEPTKKNGTLEFIYIDKNNNEYHEILNYYSDLEKPNVLLDFVSSSIINNNFITRISGKIVDENFDFDSLTINGKNSFIRIGDYFESYITVEGENLVNLEITGNDFTGNNIEDGKFGSLFFIDSRISSLEFIKSSKYGLEGKIVNYDVDNNLVLANSYSTLNLNSVYIANNFILPISQRNGIQSINLKAKELSGNSIISNKIFSVDSKLPRVNLIEYNGRYRLLIDGTLSNIISVNITKNSQLPISLSKCTEKISLYSDCFEFSDLISTDILNVVVLDEANNELEISLTLEDVKQINNLNLIPRFFFNGNDLVTFKNSAFIQGNIISDTLISSVKVDGTNCQFDDISFVCLVTLKDGINNFNIQVTNQIDSVTKTLTIEKKLYSNQINLLDVRADALYNIGGDYYISTDSISSLVDILDTNQVNVLIDGKKYLIGKKSGELDINIDLKTQVAQKNKDDFEIKVELIDENSNSIFTSFKIFYSRVIETFIDVLVE